ncbi:BadF/BadG/BcrA/BcrD ATPase family [Candidatus Ornithobacterium hominis]|uniref:BadF/BadG/BcrA/BcrD ATPase family n=1 Tax=Candidatus Ornithobacterium hominis TaxID=2497989 RepID=A0A383TWD0_9FLAO|nr:ATPase [Candidatus Ornithobacterium hominis]MCT7904781.1 ATPase [Candidatus Ornithobacterium hominis]CAI9429175.1 BadF/BadG/BcrA/BcrD ATPase family [Candidatus Ornithobacterium hominis]SZD71548.1 BadF/BadG/BcrA/BcrD ATPase family [Candidatus Ornithobacterium hominis]SZD72164.1 BadF/BadG/BcrA/BcrD ATPase family [Candidatus Ornithobacterium hominis]
MIAIIDSGSTKSDWVILDESNGKEIERAKTIGFNPFFIKEEDILKELKKNKELTALKDKINKIYFYGAGVHNQYFSKVVKKPFDEFFSKSTNLIDHDMKAAAYAAYNGKPAIVCILGTGSNSCYFDGETIKEETPALSYVLGDEGSGNHIGRQLIRAYFCGKFPTHLRRTFKERYNLTEKDIEEKVYNNQFANAYLASFSVFASDHKYEPFIQELVFNCLEEFFLYHVMPYKEKADAEINFIGSIAHYYESTLKSVANKYNLHVGNIVKKPIDDLVKYHKIYIFPEQMKPQSPVKDEKK